MAQLDLGFKCRSASGTVICVINSERTNTEYSASCKRENPCSYTEEYEPIVVFLHVFLTDVFVYEKHTRHFFIKDIRKSCKIFRFVNSTGCEEKQKITISMYKNNFSFWLQYTIWTAEGNICSLMSLSERKEGVIFQ